MEYIIWGHFQVIFGNLIVLGRDMTGGVSHDFDTKANLCLKGYM